MYVTFPFSNLATESNTDHIMMRSSQLQNVICKGSTLSDPAGRWVFLKDFFSSPKVSVRIIASLEVAQQKLLFTQSSMKLNLRRGFLHS